MGSKDGKKKLHNDLPNILIILLIELIISLLAKFEFEKNLFFISIYYFVFSIIVGISALR
jgi:hypothetical protein